MDEIDERLGRVAGLDGPAYRDAPLPSPDDEVFTEALRAIAALPEPERLERAKAVARQPVYRRLESYVVRRSTLAVRTGSAQAVRDAALALALEGGVNREAMLLLYVMWDAAQRVGLDGDAVLGEAALLSSADGRRVMEKMAARRNKSMEAHGWRLIETEAGPAYRYALSGRK